MFHHTAYRKTLSVLLAASVIAGMTLLSARAAATDSVISEFQALPSSVSSRTVALGTPESDLNLPDTLGVTVRPGSETGESEPVPDSSEDQGKSVSAASSGTATSVGDGQENAEPVSAASSKNQAVSSADTEDSQPDSDGRNASGLIAEEIPAAWTSAPEYDGSTAGKYVFTPTLPDGYSLEDGVEPPKITVAVGAGHALLGSASLTTLYLDKGSVTIGDGTVSGYDANGDQITAPNSSGYRITQTTGAAAAATGNTIAIEGGAHNIVLNGVRIDVSSRENDCAFSIAAGAAVNLTLTGSSTLKSGKKCAGLNVQKSGTATVSDASLVIEKESGGSLEASGGTWSAGIGGNDQCGSGKVTINGGHVTANAGNYTGAGIGDGDGGSGSNIVIHGGTVNATGSSGGAGIGGGGNKGGDDTVTITGGTVDAYGAKEPEIFNVQGSAGIGGGKGDNDGAITISGGLVNAVGSIYGAGIGGGLNGSGGTVTITGGTVTAAGGGYGAGIGSGNNGSAGTVTINGGTVTATGGYYGAGIGSGNIAGSGLGGTVTISGGTVKAAGGNSGAGIGGGLNGSGGTVTINGGTVTATGGNNSAGIGGGYGGLGGTVTISGSTVTAAGGDYGAGIGGGFHGSGGTVSISSSTVTATGGGYGAGIGGGYDEGIGGGDMGGGDSVTISSGNVTATGSLGGAGIGGGSGSPHGGNCGTVLITGGLVEAFSKSGIGDSNIKVGGGAGIGSLYDATILGQGGNGGTISITGGTVKAASEHYSDTSDGSDVGGGAGCGFDLSGQLVGGTHGRGVSLIITAADSSDVPELQLNSLGMDANYYLFQSCMITGTAARDGDGTDIAGVYNISGKIKLNLSLSATPQSSAVYDNPVQVKAILKREIINDVVALKGKVTFACDGEAIGDPVSVGSDGTASVVWTPSNTKTHTLTASYDASAERYASIAGSLKYTAAATHRGSGSSGASTGVPSIPSDVFSVQTDTSADLSGASIPSSVTSVAFSAIPETSAGIPQGASGGTADLQGAAAYRSAISDTSLNMIGTPFLYNLKLLDQSGNPVSFTGSVTVKLPVPAGIHGMPHVFRYESDGTLTDMNAAVKNGYLVFSTTHFSDYVIAGTGDSVTLDTKSYQMPVNGKYQIGVKLTGGKAASIKVYSTSDRTAAAVKLKNGNVQVSGKNPGTAYIMFDVYDSKGYLLTHASTRVDVETGARPKGDSTRQIGVF